MLGPLCNQTVNLETDANTLYYSLLKLKYSPDQLRFPGNCPPIPSLGLHFALSEK